VRIAVYGAGGLGAYYGARLADAGEDVTFIARGANLAAMRANGLQLLSPIGDLHLPTPQATNDPASVGEVDFVLVAVKTWQVPDVAVAMRPMVGADTVVVPFLNGVDAPYQLAHVLGEAHVLGGLSRIFSFIESPGVIRHLNDSAYVGFGRLDGQPSAAAVRLCAAFSAAGVDAEVTDDVVKALWEKLILVSSWSGMAALAQCPLGDLRDDATTRALIDQCIEEGIAVAQARGVAVSADYKSQVWAFYDSLPAGATASMMRDLWDKRPSEVDAWCGALHRIGSEMGVATPIHSMCYALLQPMERAARAAG
jgi:2-dehydropantoate 2-reductase